MHIDWSKIRFFSKEEFRADEVNYIDPEAMQLYDKARAATKVSWHPSNVKGAVARFSGSPTSRHYAIDRYSDALDFFIAIDTDIEWFLFNLFSTGIFGAIGVYFDTTGYEYSSDVMFHVDCRHNTMGIPLVWYRIEGEYTYVLNATAYKKFIETVRNSLTKK